MHSYSDSLVTTPGATSSVLAPASGPGRPGVPQNPLPTAPAELHRSAAPPLRQGPRGIHHATREISHAIRGMRGALGRRGESDGGPEGPAAATPDLNSGLGVGPEGVWAVVFLLIIDIFVLSTATTPGSRPSQKRLHMRGCPCGSSSRMHLSRWWKETLPFSSWEMQCTLHARSS